MTREPRGGGELSGFCTAQAAIPGPCLIRLATGIDVNAAEASEQQQHLAGPVECGRSVDSPYRWMFGGWLTPVLAAPGPGVTQNGSTGALASKHDDLTPNLVISRGRWFPGNRFLPWMLLLPLGTVPSPCVAVKIARSQVRAPVQDADGVVSVEHQGCSGSTDWRCWAGGG